MVSMRTALTVVVHRFSTCERADHTIVFFDRADAVGEGVSPPPFDVRLFSSLHQLQRLGIA
jgi:hypothetical protein